MKNPQKALGAAKERTKTKETFALNEERLRFIENALGSQPNNKNLREELLELASQYRGLLSLWEQAPSINAMQDEAGKVLARLKNGADLFVVLNSGPYRKNPSKNYNKK